MPYEGKTAQLGCGKILPGITILHENGKGYTMHSGSPDAATDTAPHPGITCVCLFLPGKTVSFLQAAPVTGLRIR